jgi:signal transduction histidine kinase/CheY-like chemotaxis protein
VPESCRSEVGNPARRYPTGRSLWTRRSPLNPLLTRFVRKHRPALAARVARELAPALGSATGKREAATFLRSLERALATNRIARLRDCILATARRWVRLGLAHGDVPRALFAPALPADLFSTMDGPRDPWNELLATLGPVLEAIPLPILLVDSAARIRFANAAFSAELGGPPPDGSSLLEVFSDESRAWLQPLLDDPDAGTRPSRFANVRLAHDPDCERLGFTVPLAPKGQPLGWFVPLLPAADQVFADPELTQMLQSERSQKDKFAALLAVSEAMIHTLDLETILGTIARQVRRVFQVDECTVFLYDPDEQVLKPAACDVEDYRDEVMAVRLRLGEGITGSVALSGKPEIVNSASDDPRAVQVPGTPTDDASTLMCVPLHSRGRVIGVITLVRLDDRLFTPDDLKLATLFAGLCSAAIVNARLYEDTRRAFDELRETQSQLVQSAKLNALGEMAGGVAHDFNNILAAILGRTQLLMQQVDRLDIRNQLRVIEQAALDGAHTVRRVQEFTRVRQDADFETVDLNQILEGVIELTRPVWEEGARRRGIAIEMIASLEARQSVVGNASELREVFTNLVLNAVDAMPWGGELRLVSREEPGVVLVKVADTGVGMSAETRSRIFDPFFTTKAVKGTGLGLSVAYGIITRHAGTVTVESELHLGTEFTVRFPAGAALAAPPPLIPTGPMPHLRVLVVDDEEAVLDVLGDLLRVLDQDVTCALGGVAGREAFMAGEFDVVFSDLGMPEVNGWDLALTVKSSRPEVGVVLVTGWGTQLEGGAAQAHGVDLVMSKPVSIDDLDRALRHIGERRPQRRAA